MDAFPGIVAAFTSESLVAFSGIRIIVADQPRNQRMKCRSLQSGKREGRRGVERSRMHPSIVRFPRDIELIVRP